MISKLFWKKDLCKNRGLQLKAANFKIEVGFNNDMKPYLAVYKSEQGILFATLVRKYATSTYPLGGVKCSKKR